MTEPDNPGDGNEPVNGISETIFIITVVVLGALVILLANCIIIYICLKKKKRERRKELEKLSRKNSSMSRKRKQQQTPPSKKQSRKKYDSQSRKYTKYETESESYDSDRSYSSYTDEDIRKQGLGNRGYQYRNRMTGYNDSMRELDANALNMASIGYGDPNKRGIPYKYPTGSLKMSKLPPGYRNGVVDALTDDRYPPMADRGYYSHNAIYEAPVPPPRSNPPNKYHHARQVSQVSEIL